MSEQTAQRIRLDQWLWAARFFKTRTLASEAVAGGKVHVKGQRVKPGRVVHLGDLLRIRRHQEEFVVEVTGLSALRGSASDAQTLYQESDESVRARALYREQCRTLALQMPSIQRRPNKKERRQRLRFQGKVD